MVQLQAKLDSMQRSKSILESEDKKLNMALGEAEICIANLESDLLHAKKAGHVAGDKELMQIAKLEVSLQKAELQTEKVETRAQILEERLKRVEEESRQGESRVLQLESEIEAAKEEVEEAKHALIEKSNALEQFSSRLGEGDDEGNGDDADEGDEELDEKDRQLKSMRRLLQRERLEKLKADSQLADAELAWKTNRSELQLQLVAKQERIDEIQTQWREIEVRMRFSKEHHDTERDRNEVKVRDLDVELSKLRDSEARAREAAEDALEQAARFEEALESRDQDTALSGQIKKNQDLEFQLLVSTATV